jgi:hypothetical protein
MYNMAADVGTQSLGETFTLPAAVPAQAGVAMPAAEQPVVYLPRILTKTREQTYGAIACWDYTAKVKCGLLQAQTARYCTGCGWPPLEQRSCWAAVGDKSALHMQATS